MNRIARLLLIDRLTRPDGELSDQGQDLAEEQYTQGWREPDHRIEEMGPRPVHRDGSVY